MRCNYSSVYTEQKYDVDGKQRYRFIVSTNNIDRSGDSIDIKGIDTKEYERNPAVFYNHDTENAIGNSILTKTANVLYADVWFDEITEKSKQVKAQIDAGTLKTASIGLEVFKTSMRDLTDSEQKANLRTYIKQIRTIDESAMIEWSVVTLPMNINAEIQRALEKGFDTIETLKYYTKELFEDIMETENKSGATLSQKNKDKLTNAIQMLTEILDSSTKEDTTTNDTAKEYLTIEQHEKDTKEILGELSELKSMITHLEIKEEKKPDAIEEKKLLDYKQLQELAINAK